MELRVYYDINIICPSISINRMVGILLVGGFNPSEKYESQLGLLSPIYGKIKNVPNHQPDYIPSGKLK